MTDALRERLEGNDSLLTASVLSTLDQVLGWLTSDPVFRLYEDSHGSIGEQAWLVERIRGLAEEGAELPEAHPFDTAIVGYLSLLSHWGSSLLPGALEGSARSRGNARFTSALHDRLKEKRLVSSAASRLIAEGSTPLVLSHTQTATTITSLPKSSQWSREATISSVAGSAA